MNDFSSVVEEPFPNPNPNQSKKPNPTSAILSWKKNFLEK